MREVRNSDGRLVCKVNEATRAVEIFVKGYVTLIEWLPDGKVRITNKEKTTA